MSEPLTPDQAIEILRADTWFPTMVQSHAFADLIRTLAARNAELEEGCKSDRQCIKRSLEPTFVKWNEELETAHARIREMESAARLRSCKDEPPSESGWYLCRVFDKDYADDSRYAEYFTCSFTRGLWITNDMNGCSPDQWTLLPGIHPK